MRLPASSDLVRRVLHFTRSRSGRSALEFALIFPAVIIGYVALIEVGGAYTIARRTDQVAATAADLTAQVKTVTKNDIQNIQNAAESILTPYSTDTNTLSIVISSVVADDENKGKVAWSCARSGSGHAKGSSYPVPAGLTEANSSLIVAEVTYKFKGLMNLPKIFDIGSFDMKRTFYARPRKSLQVAMEDSGCS